MNTFSTPRAFGRRLHSTSVATALAVAATLASVVTGGGCLSVAPHQKRAPDASGVAVTMDAARVSTDFAEVDGAWLRVRASEPEAAKSGAERLPVVFVHGFGSRLEAFRDLQPALATERKTLAYDHRGFGESERVAGEYGPDVHAKDLIALIRLAGFERVILVGHSYGGGVATEVALRAPELVAGLVLIDAFLLDRQVPQTFRWAKAPVVGELLFGAFYKEVPGEKYLLAFHDRERFVTAEALDEMQAIMARPGSVHAALETIRGMDYKKMSERLPTLRAPSLVVWGAEDRVTPLSQGEAIAARLNSDRLEVIHGAGHMPLWERPAAVHSAIAPFLKKLDAIERDRPTVADLPDDENDSGQRDAVDPDDGDPGDGDPGAPVSAAERERAKRAIESGVRSPYSMKPTAVESGAETATTEDTQGEDTP